MAINAYQTQYRQEFVQGFEQTRSNFMGSATTERVIKGNQAVFVVSDSGAAEAVTRGVQGAIPGRSHNVTQYTCSLQEWHDVPEITDFNEFASQGSIRAAMQGASIGVLNRKIDDLMIAELSTATAGASEASQTFSLDLIAKAVAYLAAQDVPVEETANMFFAMSPKAFQYAMQIPEFASADYNDVKVFNGPVLKMKTWYGVNIFMSNRLSGRQTATEKCLLWHRSAIGWAANTENMDVVIGRDDRHARDFVRTSLYCGAKLLDADGVYIVNHNGA